jgi:hypothetical protein
MLALYLACCGGSLGFVRQVAGGSGDEKDDLSAIVEFLAKARKRPQIEESIEVLSSYEDW